MFFSSIFSLILQFLINIEYEQETNFALLWCGVAKAPETHSMCVRTPVAGFLFTPKNIVLCFKQISPSASRMRVQ